MNKKYQSKLEDIENEVDSFKKKRGRPVGSKNKKVAPASRTKIGSVLENDSIKRVRKSLEEMNTSQKRLTPGFKKIEVNQSPIWDLSDKSHIDWDAEWDNIEVPILKKITDDFTQPKQTLPPLPLIEKITRVLIVVVVAILGYLIIKNI